MNAIAIALARPSTSDPLARHRVVSRTEFTKARLALLKKEKELMHLQDEVARARRALPWVKIAKDYVFDTPDGPRKLTDLFGANSQLIVQHFMLAPGWDAGCIGCSFMADGTDGALAHLTHHDVTFVAVSRAPLAEINAFKQRMGWRFPWVSSNGSDFNFDFDVSFTPEARAARKVYYNYRERDDMGTDEMPGISVFYKNPAGEIFHTYSTYERGVEAMMTAYRFLDLTPKGRNEPEPRAGLTQWVRLHDEYEAPAETHGCCAHK